MTSDLAYEKYGAMPGPAWMKGALSRVEGGTSAHTANVSIGQGYVLASPLANAMAYSTVANMVEWPYEPRLVKTCSPRRTSLCWTTAARWPCPISP